MMTDKKSPDVLIVGAGPVGLFCANELTRHGLSCRIVDKKSELSDKSKALGIHIRTLDVLEDCNFLAEVQGQGHRVDGALFKSNGRVIIDASFADIEANRHFLIDLPQDKTERILYEGLLSKLIAVEWDTELTEVVQTSDHVRTILKKKDGSIEHVSTSWLIACDGGHSTVRQLAGIPFEGSEYKENWWLADLLMDWKIPQNSLAFYLSKHGPLACFPMGKHRYRLVLTAPEEQTQDPTFADIQTAFKLRSGEEAVLSDPIWITKFYLHHRQIKHYRQKNVFFAGDAAHIHSPMGGQGLNTGIQDIYNLVWKLALVHHGKSPSSLLDSYHLERHPIGHKVLKETDLMTKMVTIKNPMMISVRNILIALAMAIPFIRNKMAGQMAEIDISYHNSPIVKKMGEKTFRVGYFLPNFDLREQGGNSSQILSKIVHGTTHHLFLFAGLESENDASCTHLANKIIQKYSQEIEVHFVVVKDIAIEVQGAKVWLDEDSIIHKKYSISKPCALLLRPDKYIGFTQMPVTENGIMNYLNTIFIS
jgi:2-polyprenyl-6-methoxyphenol hydroxylase-like FAD-dependent oxidoreductase